MHSYLSTARGVLLLQRFVVKRSSSTNLQKCTFRLATVDDIPFINNCNYKTLPEHYTKDFYVNQLKQFPKLSFVALDEKGEMMGYALGRVKLPFGTPFPSSKAAPVSKLGHCMSVAVNDSYRGRGVAKCLMHLLHHNIADVYALDKISLYCRPSNKSAFQFYSCVLNYESTKLEKKYYDNGEDAWYMTKTGLLQDMNKNRQLIEQNCNSEGIFEDVTSGNSGSSGSATKEEFSIDNYVKRILQ